LGTATAAPTLPAPPGITVFHAAPTMTPTMTYRSCDGRRYPSAGAGRCFFTGDSSIQ
jgi:hypothetical protein